MSHIRWTDTEQIHHLRRAFHLQQNRDKTGNYRPPVVTYRSKVKLHGTNAGIQVKPNGEVFAQSRTAILGSGNDNAGFSAWVETTKEYWAELFEYWAGTAVVYGEWCGPGIQKGTAINQIPEKSFCIFAMQLEFEDEVQLEVRPNRISDLLKSENKPENVYVLPWYSKDLTVSFRNPELLQAAVKKINEMVAEVEACDPWVKEQFGVEGIGEGLVFFPVYNAPGPTSRTDICTFLFKAKGEKHQVVKQKKPAQVDPEAAASAQAFIDLVVTEPRLEQALAEGAGGDANMKMVGPFLKWISQDVKKECVAELEAANLEWRAITKLLTTRAREWFIGKVNA